MLFRCKGVPGFGITFDAIHEDGKVARLFVVGYEDTSEPFCVTVTPEDWARLVLRGQHGIGITLEVIGNSGATAESVLQTVNGPLREFHCELRPATVRDATYLDEADYESASPTAVPDALAALKEGTNPVPDGSDEEVEDDSEEVEDEADEE